MLGRGPAVLTQTQHLLLQCHTREDLGGSPGCWPKKLIAFHTLTREESPAQSSLKSNLS